VGIRHRKTFAIGVVGMTAALLIGSAVAVAGPSPMKRGKGPLVRGVHTEVSLIKEDGTKDAFTIDRGEVTAASQSSITLLRKDGVSVALGLSIDTKVRGQIQVGKGAEAFSRDGKAFAVLAPRGPKPASLVFGGGDQRDQRMGRPDRKPGAGLFGAVHADVKGIKADKSTFSFSFDRGDVTAASPTSVTIKRADGGVVTKTISADTKVRGKLAAGGKAAVISEGSAAKLILARAPKS
jgi:hypothetical protein